MIIQPQTALIAWIPLVFLLFKKFKFRQAVMVSFVFAWLFLPQAQFPLPGLPDVTKISATCYGVLLASLILNYGFVSKFKIGIIDIPMIIYCICPFFTSLSNDLGAYDGLSSSLQQITIWGLPYFFGRIFLNDFKELKNLAYIIFIGGLIYTPLCLFEVVMSPQLHKIVYGFHAHSFGQSVRLGGYRPTIFMKHGLEVGMWMMAATLICLWLWKTSCVKEIYGISIGWFALIITTAFILVKSTGAYFLLLLGILILFTAWQLRTSIIILILILSIISYLGHNITTPNHAADRLVNSLEKIVPQERVDSLQFRIDNEMLLKEKAKQRIFLGWGGWGRNRVYDYNWRGELVDITVTDSLWIILFGRNGLIGLASLFSAFLLPVIGFIRIFPAVTWSNKNIAPVASIVVVLILYMIDSLLNNMINPIFTLACGGLSGLVAEKFRF